MNISCRKRKTEPGSTKDTKRQPLTQEWETPDVLSADRADAVKWQRHSSIEGPELSVCKTDTVSCSTYSGPPYQTATLSAAVRTAVRYTKRGPLYQTRSGIPNEVRYINHHTVSCRTYSGPLYQTQSAIPNWHTVNCRTYSGPLYQTRSAIPTTTLSAAVRTAVRYTKRGPLYQTATLSAAERTAVRYTKLPHCQLKKGQRSAIPNAVRYTKLPHCQLQKLQRSAIPNPVRYTKQCDSRNHHRVFEGV